MQISWIKSIDSYLTYNPIFDKAPLRIEDVGVITTKGLTKKFGELTAVDNLDLDIKEGEIFGLLGPNGAGKTTIISMLATLLDPTSGTATVANQDILKKPPDTL